MAKKKSPALRLFIAMAIGLFVIEMMIELSTGTTMLGGRNGIFISKTNFDATMVNSKMKARVRVITATDIYENPVLSSRTVGVLKVGTKLSIIGKTTVGKKVWYQIQRFGGKIGYVIPETVVKQ
ncbi:MAG: SH3 domain-containing protein [Rhodospirillaceae bacterium]|jgi:hypothetical protein|nr:SH3 domain-containing protein [Rhodospirillaceae bacterium]MBT5245329.1 SH3 domain-containing protein [Rhodospirillaceae bacterium]MBT5561198.1 SH3 domain-containing protein [Rhodospirillaceae bacterium]MBT6242734.1 SH3 domain-containing protein [Rhodospirillaceae bacterium]MBT7137280.1 SH3 domain-containing protein [Rhodospirillaceae bacterium]